jgi:hypothetical protein
MSCFFLINCAIEKRVVLSLPNMKICTVIGNYIWKFVGISIVKRVIHEKSMSFHWGNQYPVVSVQNVHNQHLLFIQSCLYLVVIDSTNILKSQLTHWSPNKKIFVKVARVVVQPGVEGGWIIPSCDSSESHCYWSDKASGLPDGIRASS